MLNGLISQINDLNFIITVQINIWHLVFTEGNGLYRNIKNYSYGYKETKKYLKLRHKLTHYAMSLKPKK